MSPKAKTHTLVMVLLNRMGLPLEEAMETVRLAGSAPDTQAQWDFLRRHGNL